MNANTIDASATFQLRRLSDSAGSVKLRAMIAARVNGLGLLSTTEIARIGETCARLFRQHGDVARSLRQAHQRAERLAKRREKWTT